MIPNTSRSAPARRAGAALLLAGVLLSGGCAAITNPIVDGIPVRRLPPEVLGKPREELKEIPLTLLRQKPLNPGEHKIAPGDVLGVYIENILGDRTQPLPVRFNEQNNQTPSIGYPFPVQENGTILVPYVEPVKVDGMSILDAQEAVKNAYITKARELLTPGKERIIVSLIQARTFRVSVVRQDSSGVSFDASSGTLGNTRRGSGYVMDLKVGENDVLTALNRSGGTPGLDAANEIIIQRGTTTGGLNAANTVDAAGNFNGVKRIPLRLRLGEPLPFKPEDIILDNGDIVYIPARQTEAFYTGGLIPVGEHILPRDYDLDVVEAVMRTRGPLLNGGFNQQNQFIGSVVTSGVGTPSPSMLLVLRKTATGRQIPIRVDLNHALRDPRERILVQPGDILILQERPSEALVRYLTGALRLNIIATVLRQTDINGTATGTFP